MDINLNKVKVPDFIELHQDRVCIVQLQRSALNQFWGIWNMGNITELKIQSTIVVKEVKVLEQIQEIGILFAPLFVFFSNLADCSAGWSQLKLGIHSGVVFQSVGYGWEVPFIKRFQFGKQIPFTHQMSTESVGQLYAVVT